MDLLRVMDPLIEPLLVLLAAGVAMKVAVAVLQEKLSNALETFGRDRAEVTKRLEALEKAIEEEHRERESAFARALERLYERLYDKDSGVLKFVTTADCNKNHDVYRAMCEGLGSQITGVQAQLSSTQEMIRMLVVEPTARKASAYNGIQDASRAKKADPPA